MKVDPVYLAAPAVTVPSAPSRRAFLFAGGTFLIGTVVGGACGYAAGSMRIGSAEPGMDPATASLQQLAATDLPKSGDHELDHLRWLAVKAPLDDLFSGAHLLLSSRVRLYKSDAVLWRGVERMAREVLDNPSRRVERSVIGVLVTQIGGTARPAQPDLRDLLPALRSRLSAERK